MCEDTEDQMPPIRAVALDLDGVLVVSFTAQPLPTTAEALSALDDMGLPYCVITNQNGPLYRWITGQAVYPDVAYLAAQIQQICRVLPQLAAVPWYISLCADAKATEVLAGILARESKGSAVWRREAVLHPELALTAQDREDMTASGLQRSARALASQAARLLSAELQKHLREAIWPGPFFVSDALDWRKPDCGMLTAAATAFGISTGQMAFVDDMPSGLAAAAAAGCAWYATNLPALVADLRRAQQPKEEGGA